MKESQSIKTSPPSLEATTVKQDHYAINTRVHLIRNHHIGLVCGKLSFRVWYVHSDHLPIILRV